MHLRSTHLCLRPRREPRAARGAVLIVALIFAAIVAISLGSYLQMSSTSLKLANRSFLSNAAMNLTESGLEQAIWALNQANAGNTSVWNPPIWRHNPSDTAVRRGWSDFDLPQGARGSIRVYVLNYNTTAGQPIIVARGVVRNYVGGIRQPDLERMVEVFLRRRSRFATGLVGRVSVAFSGNNASVDSWNSDPNGNGSVIVPYSTAVGVRKDRGSVGTVAVTSSVGVQNADIWGTAAVGGPSTTAISVGSQGLVGPFGTAAGVKNPNNISSDFTCNLDPVALPPGGAAWAPTATLGAAGVTATYRCTSTVGATKVYGNVTLIIDVPAGSSAITLTGKETLELAPGASLTIYTPGDVKIAGQGLLNPADQPKNFVLYGTSTSPTPQDIQIAGNGALKGLVYAPNGSIKINGNGDVMGSMVGNDITVVGNALFHYDESLANWGGSNPWGITRWRELTRKEDRDTYIEFLLDDIFDVY
jgi:hypothetical protein